MDCILITNACILHYVETCAYSIVKHCVFVWWQLYTRITKQGWFDSNKDVYIFRGVIDDVNQFLAVCLIAVAPLLLSVPLL